MDQWKATPNQVKTFLLAELCFLGISFVGPNVYARSSSWCETCTTFENSPTNCTSWDIRAALQGPPFSDSAGPVVDNFNPLASLSNPVWGPVLNLSFVNLFCMVPYFVYVLLGVLGILIKRAGGSCSALSYRVYVRASVFSGYALMGSWVAMAVVLLVYASLATWQWHHDLGSGATICPSLCPSASTPGLIRCQAEASDMNTFWHGPNQPSAMSIGPRFLVATTVVSVLHACAVFLLASLIRLQQSRQMNPAHTQAVGTELDVDTILVPSPQYELTSLICGRIRLIPRDIPKEDLAKALIEAGCRPSLAHFLCTRMRSTQSEFTCPICIERKDLLVDLDCGGPVDNESTASVLPQRTSRSDSCISVRDPCGLRSSPEGIESRLVVTMAESNAPKAPATPSSTGTGSARHCFCPTCLAVSLQAHAACPLCRREIIIDSLTAAELHVSGETLSE